MNKSVSPRIWRALALFGLAGIVSFYVHAEPAQQVIAPSKPLAPSCKRTGTMVDVTLNEKISHRYMLLMVFAKGTGGQYFGGATVNEDGCLADVGETTRPSIQARTVPSDKNQLYVLSCPNDCENPHATSAASGTANKIAMVRPPSNNNGADPLGSNPWGILSAADPIKTGGVPDGKVEIWQVTVRDACHAYALYKFHSGPDQILGRAMAKGDFLGQILVGFPNSNTAGGMQSCQ